MPVDRQVVERKLKEKASKQASKKRRKGDRGRKKVDGGVWWYTRRFSSSSD